MTRTQTPIEAAALAFLVAAGLLWQPLVAIAFVIGYLILRTRNERR